MSHYYEKLLDGTVEARHYIPMSSRPDELRPTRITDVRKWWKDGRKVVPSVTTVLDVLNKAALINWKIGQHFEQAWLSLAQLRQPLVSEKDEWVAEVKRLTEMAMDVAPSAGSDFHKWMDAYVCRKPVIPLERYMLCSKVWQEICRSTGHNEAHHTELSFVSDLGYGGQIDLVMPCYEWIIDYKTKQTAAKFKPGKMAYDEHRMQLAAYRMGLKLPKARCALLFVCLEDGQIDFNVLTEKELSNGWEMFQHALAIWKLQNL